MIRRRSRMVVIGFVVLALVMMTGYAAASVVIYGQLADVTPHCERLRSGESTNTPSAFTASSVDTAAYQMAAFEEVTFPSRDDGFELSGWYVPVNDAPESNGTVILVHGLNGCKRTSAILLPAGMLNRAGFNVLMLDLRDHGDSFIEDGRFAGGTEEYRDVLGAWDWLVNEKSVTPESIGLFGTSLGAASVLNAMGQEPRIAAVWEDSSFADLQVAIADFLVFNGFPSFFAPGAPLVGRLISGDDLVSLSPRDAVSRLNGRPLFIVHGDQDNLLPVKHAYALADAVRASGGQVEPWIAPGSGHVGAMFDYTDDYEERLVTFFTNTLN